MPTDSVVLIYCGNDADNQTISRFISDRFPGLRVLTATTESEVREHLPETEVLLAWSFPMHLLSLGRNLRWIQVMGTGVDAFVQSPGLPNGAALTNVKGVFSQCMAEYAIAYMLAHSHDIRGIIRRQQQREWLPFKPETLAGKTVGIAGLGSIGQEVARRCAALGARVIGLKREPAALPDVEKVYITSQIETFLPQCDFLVLVLPQTPETLGLLTRERLQLLKPTCFLINMGRGGVVREADLVEALRSRWLAGAALDVFAIEPLPRESPLWSLDNLFITPHIAGINRAEDLMPTLIENLDRYLGGLPLINQVDLARGY